VKKQNVKYLHARYMYINIHFNNTQILIYLMYLC